MQNVVKIGLAITLGLVMSQGVLAADTSGYWVDSSGVPVRSGFGACWHAGYWTPAMATAECDPDLMPRPTPVVSRAEPAPAPAPRQVMVEPEPIQPAVTSEPNPTTTVYFDFDKSVLKPAGKARLDDLAEQMKDTNFRVAIGIGYADRIGSDRYNMALSERRARAVKDYLVSKGIDPSRIALEAKGEREPLTEANECHGSRRQLINCLAPDRRAELEVVLAGGG